MQKTPYGVAYAIKKEIYEELKISRMTMSRWLRGVIIPNREHRTRLNEIAIRHNQNKIYYEPKKKLLLRDPNSLWDFYCCLPNGMPRADFYDSACQAMECGKTSFYDKMHGKKPITPGQFSRLRRVIDQFSEEYHVSTEQIKVLHSL